MSETAPAPNGAADGPRFERLDPPPRPAGLSPSEGMELLRQARQHNGASAPEPARPEPPEPPRAADRGLGDNGGPPMERDDGADHGPPADGVEIVIEGKPQRVSMAELMQGYLRQADYTRKTQGLGAKQQEVSQAITAFQQARDQYASRLDRFVTDAQREFDQPVDWVALARSDPLGWQEKRARYEMLQEAQREQSAVAQQRQTEETHRKAQLVQAGHQLLTQVVPGWKDPAARSALQSEIRQYAAEVGYSEAELAEDIVDPRQIIVLRHAVLGRKLSEQKVAPRPADPARPASPGRPPPAQAPKRERDARTTFDDKPSLRNAIGLVRTLKGLRPPGRR